VAQGVWVDQCMYRAGHAGIVAGPKGVQMA